MFSFFRRKKKDQNLPATSVEQDGLDEQEGQDAPLAEQAEINIEATASNSEVTVPEKEAEIQAIDIASEEEKSNGEYGISEKSTHDDEAEPAALLEEESIQVEAAEPPQPTTTTPEQPTEQPALPQRQSWMQRLSSGLKRTGQNISDVFTGGTQIDDALYEELETALLMADAGVAATQYLLEDVKQRVKDTRAKDPAQVRALLAQSLEELLKPLEAALVIGEHTPTVIMVAGVNGAGKTTSIGKLTRHLASTQHKVLLAAGDTFRAAAREQLEVWADRNQVEIISQQGGDPASVSFDAVSSGKAKKTDVVLIDTAGRLATQAHLMEELKKIRRVISKAMESAPHEVLLVVDGNTGQNALTQVKAFDDAIGLTGLIVTKLDGTAKGGVMAAIALWSQERVKAGQQAVPIYFIGVGEQVEDLQTFNAKEFAHALLQG